MNDTPSPWWYRERDKVLFAIYLIAFFGGDFVSARIGTPVAPTAQWLSSLLGPGWREPLFALAVAAMIACYIIRLWGSSYLSARVVWTPQAQTGALYVDGPYRFVRNPLYLGNAFMALSFGMLATPIGFATIAIGHAIFLPMLMAYEAQELRARFGAAYDAFARAVPAVVPRLTPADVEGSTTRHPSLAQGLRAEIFSGACVLAMIVLVSWRSVTAYWIFLALIAGGWAVQRLGVLSQTRNNTRVPAPD